ncbi:MAG: hypothetical protein ACHQE5_08345 [Actinomycetes bacterium]
MSLRPPQRLRAAGAEPECGAVVVGWFARIVITLTLVGLIAFDSISIAIARAHVNDIASDAADAAVAQYVLHSNAHDALAAAIAAASVEGGTVAPDGVAISRAGRVTTLRVTVELVPSTTLLGHLPGTGSLTENSAVAVRTVNQ